MDIERFKSNLPFERDAPEELVGAAEYDAGDYYITSFFAFSEEGPTFARQWFGDTEVAAKFCVFGEDGGSLFAFWFHEDSDGFQNAPIVFLSRTGAGSRVIANSFRQFLALLAAGSDDFAEDFQRVELDGTWVGPSLIPPSLRDFRDWLRSELNIEPADSPAAMVQAAAESQPDLLTWLHQSLGPFQPYARRELAPPAPTLDEVFASFRRAGESLYHTSPLELAPGHTVDLIVMLAGDPSRDAEGVLRRAQAGVERIRQRELELRHGAARDVLPTYSANYSYRTTGFLDEATLSRAMQLKSITFFPDGGAELCYGAGELFDERMITLSVAADGRPSTASVGD